MDDGFAGVVAALAALLATLSVTELVRVFAVRMRAVDQPGGRRVHRRPTARLGGIGIWWGFTVALGLLTFGHPLWRAALAAADPGLTGLLAGGGAVLVVGLVDDVRSLPAPAKLALQSAAALLLYALGWRVETLGLPGLGTVATGAWSLPLTLAWVVLVTNAVNLIDGLDGLACGVALVATLAAVVMLAPAGGPLVVVAAALAGALAGFLWFNLNPALIFMGDAGSLFVGFLLAGLTLRAGQTASPEAFPVVPALLLAVPLFDTLEAIRRRTVAAARASRGALHFAHEVRRRVLAPDGMHLHHQMLRSGMSARRAASVLWVAAAAYAVTGLVLLRDPLAGLPVLAVATLASGHGLRHVAGRLAAVRPAPPAPVVVVGAASDAVPPAAADGERRAA
jgi:UDP-GlcNAc:undecaprenyl-phosphate GlcNAc-1-phosphate transferase